MHPVLFLPGAGADPDFWRPVGDRMPADWPKHYLGWPGLGEQPPDPAVNGIGGLVDIVAARMDTPVHLVAQSMGGLVAVQAALRHPQFVRSLTLTGTSGGLDIASLGGADWRAEYQRNFPHAADWITQTTEDLTGRIGEIASPALLLWGDADSISPLAVGKRLAALLPMASLRIVAGGSHDFPITHAGEIAPLIRRHIEAAD